MLRSLCLALLHDCIDNHSRRLTSIVLSSLMVSDDTPISVSSKHDPAIQAIVQVQLVDVSPLLSSPRYAVEFVESELTFVVLGHSAMKLTHHTHAASIRSTANTSIARHSRRYRYSDRIDVRHCNDPCLIGRIHVVVRVDTSPLSEYQ